MPHIKIQQYPRRDDFLAADELFAPPRTALHPSRLSDAVKRAFERCLTDKTGTRITVHATPEELVERCIAHLTQRSDPILSPHFLAQCEIEEVFDLDAIAHEMQRHRMRIGLFYQYLLVELLRTRFRTVSDGKREGDVEFELTPPSFPRGVRIFMSVKKSSDTVGGQDVGGMIRRLESLALEDKNLTRPYLCVVCYATPSRGVITSYEHGRTMRRNRDGYPYSPNCEVWSPGFIFPYVTGLPAVHVYRAALHVVGEYLPFATLACRQACGRLLARRLAEMQLVGANGKIDPHAFLALVCEQRDNEIAVDDEHE